MIIKKRHPQKSKAQAMVEFAIALPVLLMLLYGILETGRLVFLYSTVVNASRQAVRWGSATGIGNGTEPRYQDCDGIRSAAKAAGYLGPFTDSNITIQWDNGPGLAKTPYCAAGAGSDNTFNPTNASRITVTVTKQFTPVVSGLVPFIQRNITATSSRTILVSIPIQPLTTPTPTYTPTNTFTPTITNTPTNTFTPTLTPLVSNTPTATLLPTLTSTSTLVPTITRTPTIAPTRVPSCNAVTHGAITKTGNTMQMTITNPYGFPLTTGAGTVTWNDDKGHQTGGDKTLNLQSITIGSTTVWTGNSSNVSTMPFTNPAVIPPNTTVSIIFTFHQSYDNFDGTESIYINLTTPGCELNPIQ